MLITMSKSRSDDKELAKLSLDMALSLSGFAGDVAGIRPILSTTDQSSRFL